MPHAWPIKRGVMIEVPSAALLAEQLAEDLDFFSIGTNDLTQYTMAAERGNANVAELQDALHPAVLRLMKSVVEGAESRQPACVRSAEMRPPTRWPQRSLRALASTA